jgi:signal transduction histidine kinase
LDYSPIVGHTLYRYRLNNGAWSAWANDHDAEFINLPHGSYTLTIQARLATGEVTDEVSLDFSIAYPFYLRWYMILLYLVFAALLVYAIFRYRLHRLNVEKERLEKVVQERTAEVVKQKDEIEEKSKSLENALDELNNAQHELIRQEKMATVGKLTQGLIDRILNPLNYINNFSKLSEGLVKDVEANIEDEKDNINEDNYEDTMDVLDMLRGNLQKVSEHGQNTTRTLKAMEEMLKDRSGGIVPMDLIPVLRQNEEMLRTYFTDDITKFGIQSAFNMPQGALNINGNAEQLSKTMMSLLGNAVYAVVKKAQREQFVPEVSLNVASTADKVTIVIRDNGIGIEDKIIEKVFDPFFTTKTTGEAAGVGLYLSREIIQNHGGDISVKSEKDVYTEFTITLPTLHTGQDYGKTS